MASSASIGISKDAKEDFNLVKKELGLSAEETIKELVKLYKNNSVDAVSVDAADEMKMIKDSLDGAMTLMAGIIASKDAKIREAELRAELIEQQFVDKIQSLEADLELERGISERQRAKIKQYEAEEQQVDALNALIARQAQELNENAEATVKLAEAEKRIAVLENDLKHLEESVDQKVKAALFEAAIKEREKQ